MEADPPNKERNKTMDLILKQNCSGTTLTMSDLDGMSMPEGMQDRIISSIQAAYKEGETDGYNKGLEAGKELENETTYDEGYDKGREEQSADFDCERSSLLKERNAAIEFEGQKEFKRGRILGYKQGLETS